MLNSICSVVSLFCIPSQFNTLMLLAQLFPMGVADRPIWFLIRVSATSSAALDVHPPRRNVMKLLAHKQQQGGWKHILYDRRLLKEFEL